MSYKLGKMNEQDYKTVENMERYGGSFVKALAECARHADHTNLKKLKNTFSEYWEKYSENQTNTVHYEKCIGNLDREGCGKTFEAEAWNIPSACPHCQVSRID